MNYKKIANYYLRKKNDNVNLEELERSNKVAKEVERLIKEELMNNRLESSVEKKSKSNIVDICYTILGAMNLSCTVMNLQIYLHDHSMSELLKSLFFLGFGMHFCKDGLKGLIKSSQANKLRYQYKSSKEVAQQFSQLSISPEFVNDFCERNNIKVFADPFDENVVTVERVGNKPLKLPNKRVLNRLNLDMQERE